MKSDTIISILLVTFFIIAVIFIFWGLQERTVSKITFEIKDNKIINPTLKEYNRINFERINFNPKGNNFLYMGDSNLTYFSMPEIKAGEGKYIIFDNDWHKCIDIVYTEHNLDILDYINGVCK